MKKTIFITGGAGFIGANLVRRLVADKYDVHIAVREHSSLWRIKDILNKITIHKGILEDADRLRRALRKMSPYAVFHLATYGAYPTQKDPYRLVDVNVHMTMTLLQCLKDIPYTHLVCAGSSSEYGKKNSPMSETDILEPNNYYGAMKAAQTHVCQVYAKTYAKPVVILRLFNVYGYYEEGGRLVHNVIQSVLQNKPILLATGKEARDLIYMDDVIDAFMTVLANKSFYGEVFNVGTGIQSTIDQLAQTVVRLTRSTSPIMLGAYEGRAWDSYRWVADMKKTYTMLHWRAQHSHRNDFTSREEVTPVALHNRYSPNPCVRYYTEKKVHIYYSVDEFSKETQKASGLFMIGSQDAPIIHRPANVSVIYNNPDFELFRTSSK